MMQWIERQTPLLLSRIIAQPVRHKAMHRLVQRHRDKNNDKDDNEVSDINMHFFIVPSPLAVPKALPCYVASYILVLCL